MILLLLLSQLLLCFFSQKITKSCRKGYRRFGSCPPGKRRVPSPYDSSCFTCCKKTCPPTFSTGEKECSNSEGFYLSYSGFEGTLPCSKCVPRDCLPGYETNLSLSGCEGVGMEVVWSGEFSGGKKCKTCLPKECPCGFSKEVLFRGECLEGFELEVSGKSGDLFCQRCKPIDCVENTFAMNCDNCGEGYLIQKTKFRSGFDWCYTCVKRECLEDYQPKSYIIGRNGVVVSDSIFCGETSEESIGYEYSLGGFSGNKVCVKCVEKQCPPLFRTEIRCEGEEMKAMHGETYEDLLQRVILDGWNVIEQGKSGVESCKTCLPLECPDEYGVMLNCPENAYTIERKGNSGGKSCKKCIPRKCPTTFSTRREFEASLKKDKHFCDTKMGFEIVSSRIKNGENDCLRCSPSKCLDGYSTSLKDCPTGYSLHQEGYSGGSLCKRCVPTPCEEDFTTDTECAESFGWKKIVGTLSGEEFCKRCEEKTCFDEFSTTIRTCPIGFTLTFDGDYSGGKKCKACMKTPCGPDFPEKAIEPACGNGYELELGGRTGEGTCFACSVIRCPEGYFTGLQDCEKEKGVVKAGWKMDINGWSAGQMCKQCVEKECPPDSFLEIPEKCLNKEDRERDGFELKKVGKSGDHQYCFSCDPTECPLNSDVGEIFCPEDDGYVTRIVGISAGENCLSCEKRQCPDGFSTTKISEDDCILKDGYEILENGKSDRESCRKCSAAECPFGSSIVLKCVESEGWRPIVVSKNAGDDCVKCYPIDCPTGTHVRSVEFRRGFEWKSANKFSGGRDCGVWKERECNEGYGTDISEDNCDVFSGFKIQISGYRGNQECKKCEPIKCLPGWKTKISHSDCDPEKGYFIKLHKSDFSAGSRCQRCEPIPCSDDYVSSDDLKCSAGFELELSGDYSKGKPCVRCSRKECDCFFATHVRCPSNLKRECLGFSGGDECCRCI